MWGKGNVEEGNSIMEMLGGSNNVWEARGRVEVWIENGGGDDRGGAMQSRWRWMWPRRRWNYVEGEKMIW